MKKLGFFSQLLTLLLAILVLGMATLLISCSPLYRRVENYSSGSFESNGERIYFTAESSSGKPITFSGGIQMMHRRTACVNCHEPEGKGGTITMMMRRFDVPDITWDSLTQEKYHEEETEHEEHPPYTEETLKRAITQGIDPAGGPLDNLMPRWRISEQDLNDLVGFIKTLE